MSRRLLWLAFGVLCVGALFLPGCFGSTSTTSPDSCTLTFENLDSQTLCNAEASRHGCRVPAIWSPLIGLCTGDFCTMGCP